MSMADDSDETGAGESRPMSHSERGKLGGRPPKTSAAEVLDALADVVSDTGRPYAKTREIVEHPNVEIGDQAVRERLHKLVDDGRVSTDKIGPARVWFPVEQETEDADT